ncbi:GntR family transcriptional regulator [Micromonospora eburnea]|uniref:Transcriptional regulator, GntR family n=1 Tax=Micromonospora eburnea TaxID=227316 RepID=A0A1C6VFX6_9ACTN|nr:GntR family transcriptional regulator [Micromonospora eburnea]SCL64964.1 transcriptional regulator, GntR family [Micromonospora eburnea]
MATKYDRIAADLREQIVGGTLHPGQQLPPETTLRDHYRVSLVTMRRALDELAAEGLIEKRHGYGTFVRKPRQRVVRDATRHQWEKDRARLSHGERFGTGATERDTGLEMKDLDFRADYAIVPADKESAQIFGVPAGTKLLKRVYRTKPKSEEYPLGLGHSLLVHDVVAKNPDLLDSGNEPWPGGTQAQLYTLGIELGHIKEEIIARPPSASEAEQLGIDSGVSVFDLRKISFDINGRVVEIANTVLAGDRTQLVYTINLDRWQ